MIRKKLIEVALPLDAINRASQRESYIYKRNPSSVHKWWAQRPLAACRAVLFAQLVDDPSAWPDIFPTEQEQDRERRRIFRIIEELVKWENSNNSVVLDAARLEIARSFARGRLADGEGDERDQAMLVEGVSPRAVLAYLAEVVPPVHDPFAGGGTIPLEAQRLGLRAIATDLNPVAVLINKALIEIPPKFAERAPVGPVSQGDRQAKMSKQWPGATGLAEDIRRYGAWMREEARKRIGHLYPDVDLPDEHGGGKATVIAWLWARTVKSPNPAFRGVHVPLVASFWLSKKKGKETWIEPIIDGQQWQFAVHTGKPKDRIAIGTGTVSRSGARCLLSGEPIPLGYVRTEAKAGRLGTRLMAIVVEGPRRRMYLSPSEEDEALAASALPPWQLETELPERALGFRVQQYGMDCHAALYTARQATALAIFTELIPDVRVAATQAAREAGWDTIRHLQGERSSSSAYGDAIGTYLAMAIDKMAEYCNQLVVWFPKEDRPKGLFARQAIPMVWDYAETNPFTTIGGSFLRSAKIVGESLELLCPLISATVEHGDAASRGSERSPSVQPIISTDPPYYDNVPYADLSDFFYVWLRHSLRETYPSLFRTMLVPKADELVAEPFRHGGRDQAHRFFENGMSAAVQRMAETTNPSVPVTIYYAFKQTETGAHGTTSTGWETFLKATIRAGFSIDGTWPMNTERAARSRDIGSNALASSIVLVCRKRLENASTITRGRFRRLLRSELPGALRAMEKGSVAPVDMAQASIGPGMAIFSRHAAVLEADDTTMTVRSALQLINEVVDELRGEEEGELDRETRFAVTWFETRGYEQGPYGEAEVLATARAVSVQAVAEAGICHAAAGKVRPLQRSELPDDWGHATDNHLTIWEATQHLIKRLDEQGEGAAGALLTTLGDSAEAARVLAYRLYTVCERRGWAEEGRAYNGLVIAWPDLERMAGDGPALAPGAKQRRLF